jgi:hypothetical protein
VRQAPERYVSGTMLYEFLLPTKANKVPAGSDWIHEIKHDGYRMMVVRDQDRGDLSAGAAWIERGVSRGLSQPRRSKAMGQAL